MGGSAAISVVNRTVSVVSGGVTIPLASAVKASLPEKPFNIAPFTSRFLGTRE